MKRFILFALVTMCLGASCCKKEPEPITRLIPAEMKAYWDFKQGSWWVYQDSASGAYDTVTVTEYKNYEFDGTLSHSGEPARCEYLEILTYSPSTDYSNRYWINTTYSSSQGLDYNAVTRSKFGGGEGFIGGTKCFVYPFLLGNATYDGNAFFEDTIVMKNRFQSLWGFNDVVQINQNYNLVDGHQHTRTYFAKNVGIIKQVLVDSNVVKTLVSYNLTP